MDFKDQNNNLVPVLSVTEFIEYVNAVISRKQVVVEGEITGFNISQNKWVFFDLKDENGKVGCFCLKYILDMQYEDGMQVRVYGVPRVHNKSGRFSIYIDRIEACGAGALKKAFELTKAKLEKEGIFASERKRSIIRFPEKIGLICSKESAAYTDFMRIVNQRWGGLEIYLAHVAVQGEQAVKEIVNAFEWFNNSDLGLETLVLIRGGGSLEDLQAFNSESVARAVFGSKIPVVCGVGHERDESLSDYAADLRAATPTHAATLVVQDRDEIGHKIDNYVSKNNNFLQNILEWYKHRVENVVSILENNIDSQVHRFNLIEKSLFIHFSRLDGQVQQLNKNVSEKQERLIIFFNQISSEYKNKIIYLTRSLNSFSPLSVLKRGYSIIKKKGRVVLSKSDLKTGDKIDIKLSDGELPAKIISSQGELF